jgi:6-phosphogluconolactonase/glucosamine-6-phosphate isomerase/deaminase
VDLPPIQLERDPQPPPLRDTVAFEPSTEDALAALAHDLTLQATACVREFGSFHLAFSGGSQLKLLERLCRELMTDPAYRSLPWRDTHVWTIDEAPVAHNHPSSVYGLLRDFLIGHSGIPRDQVHGVSAFRPAADAEYERTLQKVLRARPAGHDRLDMAVLSLNSEGVAGRLDPDHAAPSDRLVVRLPDEAVTLTHRMLAGSRFMGVLAVGQDVRPALQNVASGKLAPVPELLGGHTRWYIDHDASPQEDW